MDLLNEDSSSPSSAKQNPNEPKPQNPELVDERYNWMVSPNDSNRRCRNRHLLIDALGFEFIFPWLVIILDLLTLASRCFIGIEPAFSF
jgi:hypothetical protein